MDELIKKHIVSIFFSIILAGIITGVGMVVSSNTRGAVFGEQFKNLEKTIEALSTRVEGLSNELKVSSRDKWSRSDHDSYAAGNNIEYQYFKDNTLRLYEKIEERVRALEQKKSK